MTRTLARGLFTLVILLVGTADVRGEPIEITGGSARVGSVTGGPFTLTTKDFLLSGGMNYSTDLGPYRAGETVQILTHNSGLDLRTGSGMVGGVSYDRLFYEGVLKFDGSVVIPPDSSGVFTLSTPFLLTGSLLACTTSTISGCQPGNIVFNSPLVGRGIATVTMNGFDAGGSFGVLYNRRSVNYELTPVPEPSTLLLFGGALGVMAWRHRKGHPRSS